MKNNSADVPPVSPVAPQGDPEVIELVPYGHKTEDNKNSGYGCNPNGGGYKIRT